MDTLSSLHEKKKRMNERTNKRDFVNFGGEVCANVFFFFFFFPPLSFLLFYSPLFFFFFLVSSFSLRPPLPSVPVERIAVDRCVVTHARGGGAGSELIMNTGPVKTVETAYMCV